MTKDLGSKIQQSAKDGVQKSAPVTTFVGMNSVQIGDFLKEKYFYQIAQLLPVTNKLSAERIIAQSVLVISQNDSLKECTPQSVIGSIMKAAMYGFNPNAEMGQCWFIPYNNNKQIDGNWVTKKECQFQIGVRGWVKMLQNTGLVKRIINKAVHVDDEFSEVCGSKSEIIHKPCGQQVTWDTIHASYAIIEIILKDGSGKILLDSMGQPITGVYDLVMYKPELDRIRKKGVKTADKSKLQGGWVDDAGEMAKAKVLKKLIKDELSHSDELMNIVGADEKVFDISDANMATKEIIATPDIQQEEPENVEAVEVVEVQEVIQVNPQNIGNNTEFYKWFEWAKGYQIVTFNEKTVGEITRRILIGEIDIKEVPNEWLNSVAIENAVLTAEQKDKYIGKNK